MDCPFVLTQFSFLNADKELQTGGKTLHVNEGK
jgi:hypothetical protein